MASINDLDNPLLVLILNRLCIQKLFTAGHVCVRWNALRDMSLSERKELLLMVGNDAKRYIDESELKIPEMDKLVDGDGDVMFPKNDQNVQLQIYSFPLEIARLLETHFTNLTTLTISSRVNDENLRSIINLLEQFNRPNGQLHTLKLYSNRDDPYEELNDNQINSFDRLLDAANSIDSLRKWTLDLSTEFFTNLLILTNLEEFEFESPDYVQCLYDPIMRYALNNPRLRRICINNNTAGFTWLLALPAEFASRFKHLSLFLMADNKAHFQALLNHFSQLTSLEIVFQDDYSSIFTLFRPLTQLPNLLSLKISTNCNIVMHLSVTPNQREIMNFELPSVKVLTIEFSDTIHSHNLFHECNMSHLFPNVQVVRVIRDFALCVGCFWKRNNATVDVIALEEHCSRYMFRHFAHCRHLRMVCSKVTEGDPLVDFDAEVVGPRYRQWAWNEMEPFEDEVEEEGDEEIGDEEECDEEEGDEEERDEEDDEEKE